MLVTMESRREEGIIKSVDDEKNKQITTTKKYNGTVESGDCDANYFIASHNWKRERNQEEKENSIDREMRWVVKESMTMMMIQEKE